MSMDVTTSYTPLPAMPSGQDTGARGPSAPGSRNGTGRLIGELPSALASFAADASQIACGAIRASGLSLPVCR